VTALAHRALGRRLKTYFIDNGIMRKDEPKEVAALFKKTAYPSRSLTHENSFSLP